jgi:hypothetical protein
MSEKCAAGTLGCHCYYWVPVRDATPRLREQTAAGRWQSLIEHLEKEIPSLLERCPTTPGVSMAVVAGV